MRKLVIKNWMCLLELFRGMGRGWWVVEMTCTCLGGFLLRGSNAGKWGDHIKKDFFINNSVGLYVTVR